MLAALVLLALLTWQVAAHGAWWRWETRADAAVLRAAGRHPGVTPVAQAFADFGDLVVALPLLAVAIALAVRRTRTWRTVLPPVALMALTGVVVTVFKALVARPAPGAAVLGAHSGYFPSGHAATWAMACGLTVAVLFPPAERPTEQPAEQLTAQPAERPAERPAEQLPARPTARRLMLIAAVPSQLAVGAALVWRGYHWPFDVVASWCLCWVLLVTGLAVTRWWGTRG